MRRLIIRGIILIVCTYLLAIAYLSLTQMNQIYFPTNQDFESCALLPEAEPITFGNTRAYYRDQGEALVVLYHGNAGSACDRAWYALELFDPLELSYLIVEYTGYSNDTEQPSAEKIRANAEDVVQFIKESKHDRIAVIGESIGSGPASYQASLLEPDVLIYSTPFESLERLGKEVYPLFPVSLLIRENFDNPPFVKDLNIPIHIVHGEKDEIISVEHVTDFYNKLTTKEKTLTIVKDAGHNDIYNATEWNERMRELLTSL